MKASKGFQYVTAHQGLGLWVHFYMSVLQQTVSGIVRERGRNWAGIKATLAVK